VGKKRASSLQAEPVGAALRIPLMAIATVARRSSRGPQRSGRCSSLGRFIIACLTFGDELLGLALLAATDDRHRYEAENDRRRFFRHGFPTFSDLKCN
jgi:hypothetical protein